jgi:glutathionylspermidine synthase
LFTTSGERIDVLYKLYPTEYLIKDKAPDGTAVGLLLMELVRKRLLAVINPPISFLLQNKALMAVLWAMHLEQSELFTTEEHAWIEQYVLPTYFTPYDAHGQPVFTAKHVVKPVYGREGVSVTIRNTSEIVEKHHKTNYNNQVMVYQDYAPLPKTTIQTENGLTEVHLVHNCFVVGGTASAIGVRACQKRILDNSSYFLPICFPNKEERKSQ